MFYCKLILLGILVAGDGVAETQKEARHWFNLRIGAAAGNGGHVRFCGEGFFSARLSFEACGNGEGVFHQREGVDRMRLEVKYGVGQYVGEGRRVLWTLGAGLTELSLGEDAIGFNFGKPSVGNESVTGPSISTGITWLEQGTSNIEWVGSVLFSVAALNHASSLRSDLNFFQPSIQLSFGAGY